MSRKSREIPVRKTALQAFVQSFWGGIAVAALGILLGQAILYGPSLIGRKILLPLRLLTVAGSYLPTTDQYKDLVPHNTSQSDLVLFMEPERQFVNSELRAGRIPLWTPYRFAGTPLYLLGLSPPWLPAYLISSPVVLAWTQLLVALIAGLGMFYFCRRILGLSPWPSVIAAWCYPITGAYVLWVGQWIPAVMCWLPWTLAAVDRAVRKPRGWGGPALGFITALLLIGGALDIAGQVLLVSGLYALWCLWDQYRQQSVSRQGLRAAGTVALACLLGFACSSWILIPAGEFFRSGSRLARRGSGSEERPPIGLAVLPQVVLPDMYGSSVRGSYRIGTMLLPESSAAAYAGSAGCLVLAPLAWVSRKRRPVVTALAFLTMFSLSWTLNIPGMVQLLRLPVLNMMSHNRLVFVASFTLIALAAIGLEVLLRKETHVRSWFAFPAIVLLSLCGWCLFRAFVLPEPIASELGRTVEKTPIRHIDEEWEVEEIQRSFRRAYAVNSGFCAIGAVIWFVLIQRSRSAGWLAPAIAVLLPIELIYFGYGFASQARPALYFPKIPILERIGKSPPGRIIGFSCLPANLAQAVRLADVRGYDGIDPKRVVELLLTARIPPPQEIPYAITQFLSPILLEDPRTGSPRLHPILDMLNVRYVIFRGTPPPDVRPIYTDTDYWVLTNDRAMPRAFVPRNVTVAPDPESRLNAMSLLDFDPRETAYVERPVKLSSESSGTVELIEDAPRNVTLRANMKTPGLVVLADRWDKGWRAYVDGVDSPVMRANHALRGVRVDPGVHTIRFVYEPASLYLGLAIATASGMFWLAWAWLVVRRYHRGAQVFRAEEIPDAPVADPVKRIGKSRKTNRRAGRHKA